MAVLPLEARSFVICKEIVKNADHGSDFDTVFLLLVRRIAKTYIRQYDIQTPEDLWIHHSFICAAGAGKVGNIIKTESAGFTFTRRIGNTCFKVNVHFDPDTQDTFEDKVMRLIQNEAVQSTGSYDIMPLQPMSRQSERSA